MAKTIRISNERILAAIELGLSCSRLEGLNSKVRLNNHRSYGHSFAAAVITLIDLCHGGRTENKSTEKAGMRQSVCPHRVSDVGPHSPIPTSSLQLGRTNVDRMDLVDKSPDK